MHTIIVTAVSFVLLGLMAGLIRPRDAGARRFIPVWLAACILHLVNGVPGALGLVPSRTFRTKA